MLNKLVITKPDDWHVHFRDADVLKNVVPHTAKQMGRAIIMPNLNPPVTTSNYLLEYKQRILNEVPFGCKFEPLMTLYLTENMSVEQISQARDNGLVACKLYPAGATTNSNLGVKEVKKIYHLLEFMQRNSIILLMHGEVTDSSVDIFDREACFIERVLIPIRKDFPELKIVFEHLTTKQGVDYVLDTDKFVGATITPQHLLYNRNNIFSGGLRPHNYCLPILKREEHRQALLKAATGGNSKFFLGTDTAPHSVYNKQSNCGCAGCFSAVTAIELYAEVFDMQGCLDKLEGFASFYGADFYSMERNKEKITLVREPWIVPEEINFGKDTVRLFYAGETLNWKVIYDF